MSGIILNVRSVDVKANNIWYLPNTILKKKDVPEKIQPIKIMDINLYP